MDSDIIHLQGLCLRDYHTSQGVYHASLAASILLAIMTVVVRHVWLRDLSGAPALAQQFYMVMGIAQLLVALAVLLIFVPHCASGCEAFCSNKYKPAYFIYPILGTIYGILLLRESRRHGETAKQILRQGDHEGTFQPVAQQEMMETELP